jgi:hypothetical protein
MHRTTYSTSLSVKSTGNDDLNIGPKWANSGITDNCSKKSKNKLAKQKINL